MASGSHRQKRRAAASDIPEFEHQLLTFCLCSPREPCAPVARLAQGAAPGQVRVAQPELERASGQAQAALLVLERVSGQAQAAPLAPVQVLERAPLVLPVRVFPQVLAALLEREPGLSKVPASPLVLDEPPVVGLDAPPGLPVGPQAAEPDEPPGLPDVLAEPRELCAPAVPTGAAPGQLVLAAAAHSAVDFPVSLVQGVDSVLAEPGVGPARSAPPASRVQPPPASEPELDTASAAVAPAPPVLGVRGLPRQAALDSKPQHVYAGPAPPRAGCVSLEEPPIPPEQGAR